MIFSVKAIHSTGNGFSSAISYSGIIIQNGLSLWLTKTKGQLLYEDFKNQFYHLDLPIFIRDLFELIKP